MATRRFLIDNEGNIVPFSPGKTPNPCVHPPFNGIEFDDEGMPPFKHMSYDSDLIYEPCSHYYVLPSTHPTAKWIQENGEIYKRSDVQESELEEWR